MYGFLVGLEILIAIVLVIVVLMQASKGGGLAGTFGGAQIGAVFGVRRTADFLSKLTAVLGAVFLILSLLINYFLPGRSESAESIIQRGAPQLQSVPPPRLPQTSTPPANPTPQN